MLTPSYTELMEVLNEDENLDNKITSRYTIVVAAAKRARQLVYGDQPLAEAKSDKAVSIAINEMAARKIKIKLADDVEEPLRSTDNIFRTDYLSQEDLGFE